MFLNCSAVLRDASGQCSITYPHLFEFFFRKIIKVKIAKAMTVHVGNFLRIRRQSGAF
ncbi:hypothetical protein RAZWK3B_15453 [Roseobacter sp. AzwK-3b]|nr:hypothetical protein RAZWK3B_15453 [Roseobacter sp. AzwK-3b]